MDTVKRKALLVFTHFQPGFGMVHGNPDAEDAKIVNVPVGAVEQLVAEGKIGEDDVKPAKASRAAAPAASGAGSSNDGKYTATRKPFGKYEITGPGLLAPEIVTGRAAMEARLAQLNEKPDPSAPVD